MLQIKGNTNTDENPYQVSEISFEKKDGDYYVNFHFNKKELAKTFYSYMRITMASLMSDEYEPQKIVFLLVNPPSEINDVVSLKGNVHQAIQILIQDDTIKGQLKYTLLDSEEEDLQRFLKESENCEYEASLSKFSTTENSVNLNISKKKPHLQADDTDTQLPSKLKSF